MAEAICSILEDASLRDSLGKETRMQEEQLEEFDAASFWRLVFRNAILNYESVPKTDPTSREMWDCFWEGEFRRDNAEYTVHWREHLKTEEAENRAREAEAALLAQQDSDSSMPPKGSGLRNTLRRLVHH